MNEVNKTSHIDIAYNPDVKDFLNQCECMREPSEDEIADITNQFVKIDHVQGQSLPENIITIDSNGYESPIRKEIPFTNIGYIKLVDSLLKNSELIALKNKKFLNPFKIAQITDEVEAMVMVLPGSNIKYKSSNSPTESFRMAIDEFFNKTREKIEDSTTSLKETLFWLASYRHGCSMSEMIIEKCPNPNCEGKNLKILNIEENQYCPLCGERIFATDSLRFYEEFEEFSPSNLAVMRRIEKAIRHIYLAHLLRIIMKNNKESYLSIFENLAIIINGSLSVAGTAAWLFRSMMKIIFEINGSLRQKGKSDLLIIGIVQNGLAIRDYANMIERHLAINTLLCVSDIFRDKYINFNREASNTTFGSETYYGQDFIWKNKNGVMIFNLPYFIGTKENIEVFKVEKSDYKKYNNLLIALCLINELRCDMNATSISPLMLSSTYTTISMKPGAKVLDMLTKSNIL